MLKKGGAHETAYSVLLVGGHTVAASLLSGQTELAVYEALGVGACVLIFILMQEALNFAQKRDDEEGK